MTSFTAKTLFFSFLCVCRRLHIVDNTNYHSSSNNRIYTSGGNGSALQIFNTQQTYQPAGFLHSSDIVRLVCRLLCELRYRCVQPTVLCYMSGNTTEEVDGEPTATANTFYSCTIAVRPPCRITHTLLQWCNGGRECLMCIIHHCCARCIDLHIFDSRR